jgi:TIR domain-containing protein
MTNRFAFDVFLGHSSRDKAVVRAVAEQVRKDGRRVWLDHWEIRPGDGIPAKIAGHNHGQPRTLCDTASGPRV